ncbi:MAG: hypothetical protein GY725_17780 [bacterium]|nr:hypothetical protein [bacterium]
MRYAQGLRFPTLFLLTGSIFLLDLVIPDMIPMGDEILLGLGTMMLASMKKPPASPDEEPVRKNNPAA